MALLRLQNMARNRVVELAQSATSLIATMAVIAAVIWFLGWRDADEPRSRPIDANTSGYEQRQRDSYQQYLIDEGHRREQDRQQELEDARDEGYSDGYDEGFEDSDMGDYSPDGP
ncbi:hypothetical protein [Lentzea sp. NPDC059081]|uniref:hypothetical protein n=1 Tax=Lentzea sp. NPDC059081 TaxID=3346719 RepID=UPI0036AB3F03